MTEGDTRLERERPAAESPPCGARTLRQKVSPPSWFKGLLKEKEISEDEERGAEEEVQQLTDKYVSEVDKVLAEKEAELMEV